MAKDWAKLAGEKGKKVEKGRLRRALKLGGLATRVTGSMIKAQIGKMSGRNADENLDSMASAAVENAQRIVDVMGQMKGAAMKIGQILSSDPDMIDPAFAERLATLQREAPPMDFVTLSAQIEEGLDQPIDAVFKFFDPEPLGAASIGQVHRGTLFDGREVAVKVQYPGVAESLESDLQNMATLIKLGRVIMTKERADAFVAEARAALLQETNYELEASNLTRFADYFADRPGVRVPRPIPEYVRPTVMVMEFVDGRPFDEAVNEIEDVDKRNLLATRFVETFVYMFHDLNVLHADPHPGNFMLDSDDNIVLLDFGCVRDFSAEMADSVLHMLDAYWTRDIRRLTRIAQKIGFGRDDTAPPEPDVFAEYLDMILEPLANYGPFRFAEFKVHGRVRNFLRTHLTVVRFVPPADLLMYFRVLAGMKGMMTRIDAAVELRQIAEACCKRRGIP